jgi:uncharacterized protein YndB with AHSA1/START domain
MPIDWSAFTKRIAIYAPIEKLYAAWSSRNGIEHWFLRKALYKGADGTDRDAGGTVQVGDTYTWYWHGYNDDTFERGKVLQANGKDVFEFTFGKAGIVRVELTEERNYVLVSLTQYNIPVDEKGKEFYHVGCGEGWTFHLTNFRSIMEGGADLRNRDEKITRVINS